MMLGKRHSKEDFSDILDDLKRSFFAGKDSSSNVDLTFFQKSVS